MTKSDAIFKLNPNVVTVRGGNKAYDKDDNEVTTITLLLKPKY